MTTATLPTIPTTIPVTTGVYVISDDLSCVEGLSGLRGVFQELSHLMALTPEKDLEAAEFTENMGWLVETDCEVALKYASSKYYLSEVDTALITLINKYAGDISDKELDDLLDAALERDYRIDQLTDGLYLVFS